MRVRTRMAPSPTGEYHIGHIRTLLYNFAWARKNKGQFIIRIEDTDRERLVPGAVERILQVISDYGFSWDEGPKKGGAHGPYVQSERLPIYKKYAQKLVEKGAAYYCFCSKERLEKLKREQQVQGKLPRYDGKCREIPAAEAKKRVAGEEGVVVRLRVPTGKMIEFEDVVMGKVKVKSDEVDDQILLKSDGWPTYHLAVVVDDHLMEISHVLRGAEWISSTPKHVLLYEAWGWEKPVWGHLPVLLSPAGGKMSKRQGEVAARAFLDEGYLPEAMVNFLALLGWTHPAEKEMFSQEEFIEEFDITKIHKSNPVFDRKKLDWLNGLYIRHLEEGELVKRLSDFRPKGMDDEMLREAALLVKDRLAKLADFSNLTEFLVRQPEVKVDLFEEGRREHLMAALAELAKVEWKEEEINETLQGRVRKEGWQMSKFFMNLRVAVCGSRTTPPLSRVMMILGRKETLERIEKVFNL